MKMMQVATIALKFSIDSGNQEMEEPLGRERRGIPATRRRTMQQKFRATGVNDTTTRPQVPS